MRIIIRCLVCLFCFHFVYFSAASILDEFFLSSLRNFKRIYFLVFVFKICANYSKSVPIAFKISQNFYSSSEDHLLFFVLGVCLYPDFDSFPLLQ